MSEMELKDLIGRHILSGIETGQVMCESFGYEEECEYIKFTLDGVHYMAVEDPDDGYRSYMRELEISDTPCRYSLPDVEVECHMLPDCVECSYENDILVFVDVRNGKEVLSVGTGATDDYYPYCVLNYKPENLSCNEGKVAG